MLHCFKAQSSTDLQRKSVLKTTLTFEIYQTKVSSITYFCTGSTLNRLSSQTWTGFVWQQIQEPLTQEASMFRVVGVKSWSTLKSRACHPD